MNDTKSIGVPPRFRFRRLLLAAVSLLLVVFAAVAVIATNVRTMEFVIRQVLQRTAPEVQAFSLGSLSYSFPSSWILGNIRATVLSGGKPALIYAARIEVKDALHLLTDGKHAGMTAYGVEAAYDKLKVKGASCAVELNRLSNRISYRGNILLTQVSQEPLSVSDIRMDFSGDDKSVALSNLTAAVYGGQLSGAAVFTVPASFDVDLALQEVDSGELERALGGVFRELGGKLSGRLHIAGAGQRIDLFDTSWNMPSGGAVSAALLSSVIQYIPDSTQKKRLDFLVRSGGKLAVESFLFTLKNDTPERLSGQIGIKSREANLELNVTHEIRVDARIDSVLQAWQAVFK
jgi:hypothetical protein